MRVQLLGAIVRRITLPCHPEGRLSPFESKHHTSNPTLERISDPIHYQSPGFQPSPDDHMNSEYPTSPTLNPKP